MFPSITYLFENIRVGVWQIFNPITDNSPDDKSYGKKLILLHFRLL